MAKVKVNDIEMYYEQQGNGEDLVLISGGSVDNTTWDPIYKQLTKSYRVLRFDNRGAGKTDAPPGNYTIPQMADDTAVLMNKLNIKSAYIIGHSMGGYIAQQLTLTHPSQVKKLVLVTSRAKPSAACALLNKTWQEMLKQGVPLELVIKNVMGVMFSNDFLTDEQKVQHYLKEKLNNPIRQTLRGLKGQQAAVNTYDSSDRLAKINVPTLIIGAEDDSMLPLFNSQFLAQAIPHAKLAVLKNCGHMPQYEKPEELFKLIYRFCR